MYPVKEVSCEGFIVVDYKAIYCADYKMKNFKRLEFSNLNIMKDDENIGF